MKYLLPAILAVSLSMFAADAAPKSAAGTWEGESKCTVPNSPCHDEHVVYEISDTPAGRTSIDAYKIVGGEKQFMGTIVCDYDSAQGKLHCPFENARGQKSNWDFAVSGETMTGTLVLEEGNTLYRKINVRKTNVTKK
jgi:hypothetical protein